MSSDAAICLALQQLDAIANGAMTAEQRHARARPVLSRAGLSESDLLGALSSQDLAWNEDKAREFGVDVQTWLRAVDCVRGGDSLRDVLDCLHRAESAAQMLKAGYRPERGAGGAIEWRRE